MRRIRQRHRPNYPAKPEASSKAVQYIGVAALLGAVVGVGSVAVSPGGFSVVADKMKAWTETRTRPPQPGDNWSGCDAARAAGTAPIYRGEPGYRVGMDGDSDGIACEPYRN